jgi:hypothetical protein
VHATKTYCGSEDVPPLILNVGTTWRSVSFTSSLPLPAGKCHVVPTEFEAGWASERVWMGRWRVKSRALLGLWNWSCVENIAGDIWHSCADATLNSDVWNLWPGNTNGRSCTACILTAQTLFIWTWTAYNDLRVWPCVLHGLQTVTVGSIIFVQYITTEKTKVQAVAKYRDTCGAYTRSADIGGFYSGDKAEGAWNWPYSAEVKEWITYVYLDSLHTPSWRGQKQPCFHFCLLTLWVVFKKRKGFGSYLCFHHQVNVPCSVW